MPTQTESGKAFEYALLMAIYNKINNGQKIKIIENHSLTIAKHCFMLFNREEQTKYDLAAKAASNHLVTIEPRMENPLTNDNEDMITLSIQADKYGMSGDVRDVLTVRSKQGWEIGFSAKNDHSAVKHSRLSDKIDFGEKWFGINCSKEYFVLVKEIFGRLRKLKEQQKKPPLKWREIDNKERSFYIPVLNAFKNELKKLNEKDPKVPQKLLEYLIGVNDFYKVIKSRNYTEIQGYNLHGTLNQPANKTKPLNKVPLLKFPTKIIKILKEGTNTIKIIFDEGWQLSFRIHNASTEVEPSLKFDIQLDGRPNSLYTHYAPWHLS